MSTINSVDPVYLSVQICVFQRCTQISSLQFVEPCPVGSNNLTCSGTGVSIEWYWAA